MMTADAPAARPARNVLDDLDSRIPTNFYWYLAVLALYRVKTRRRDAGLRFGLVGRLRHDRGSCLSVCCI
jgi:hypothetical protein